LRNRGTRQGLEKAIESHRKGTMMVCKRNHIVRVQRVSRVRSVHEGLMPNEPNELNLCFQAIFKRFPASATPPSGQGTPKLL
jgi:hypothetical protein